MPCTANAAGSAETGTAAAPGCTASHPALAPLTGLCGRVQPCSPAAPRLRPSSQSTERLTQCARIQEREQTWLMDTLNMKWEERDLSQGCKTKIENKPGHNFKKRPTPKNPLPEKAVSFCWVSLPPPGHGQVSPGRQGPER